MKFLLSLTSLRFFSKEFNVKIRLSYKVSIKTEKLFKLDVDLQPTNRLDLCRVHKYVEINWDFSDDFNCKPSRWEGRVVDRFSHVFPRSPKSIPTDIFNE